MNKNLRKAVIAGNWKMNVGLGIVVDNIIKEFLI